MNYLKASITARIRFRLIEILAGHTMVMLNVQVSVTPRGKSFVDVDAKNKAFLAKNVNFHTADGSLEIVNYDGKGDSQ